MAQTKTPKTKTPRTEGAAAGTPLLVSVRLGATIPTGQFGNIRPEAEVRNIRADATDEEVKAQISRAIEVVGQAWLMIDDELEVRISEMLSPEAGAEHPEMVRDRIAALESYVSVNKTNMGKVATAIRDLKEAVGKKPAKGPGKAGDAGGDGGADTVHP